MKTVAEGWLEEGLAKGKDVVVLTDFNTKLKQYLP